MWVSGCIFCIFWIACRNRNLDRPALTFPDCKSEEKERDGKWKGGRANPRASKVAEKEEAAVDSKWSPLLDLLHYTRHTSFRSPGGAQLGHYTGH